MAGWQAVACVWLDQGVRVDRPRFCTSSNQPVVIPMTAGGLGASTADVRTRREEAERKIGEW
jgi:hypothetical protein